MTPVAADPDTRERAEMWANFFWACKLGTVLRAADQSIWQKWDKFSWRTIGAASEYSAESIAWPVDVLLEGIE